MKIPVFLVFPVFLAGVTGVTRVTGKTGEFESRLFSGRCEALRRRVADEMVAHSNLFESGLAVRLLHYLRKIATPPRKGYTKSFWFRFLQKAEKKLQKKENEISRKDNPNCRFFPCKTVAWGYAVADLSLCGVWRCEPCDKLAPLCAAVRCGARL